MNASSKPCGKCGRKPAYWHRNTLSFLCADCKARFIRNQQRQARTAAVVLAGLQAVAGASLLAAMLITAAGLWLMFGLALGLEP